MTTANLNTIDVQNKRLEFGLIGVHMTTTPTSRPTQTSRGVGIDTGHQWAPERTLPSKINPQTSASKWTQAPAWRFCLNGSWQIYLPRNLRFETLVFSTRNSSIFLASKLEDVEVVCNIILREEYFWIIFRNVLCESLLLLLSLLVIEAKKFTNLKPFAEFKSN